jgi:hypothetical protein
VKIAELDDAQAVKPARHAPQADFQAGDLQPGGVMVESASADGSQAGSAKQG